MVSGRFKGKLSCGSCTKRRHPGEKKVFPNCIHHTWARSNLEGWGGGVPNFRSRNGGVKKLDGDKKNSREWVR